VSLDAALPQQYRFAEESLLILSGVFWLGWVGVWAIGLSLARAYPGWPERRLAHWTGIVLALLPAAWFVVGWFAGWVSPREVMLFDRILV
jgi:hypothetical protein